MKRSFTKNKKNLEIATALATIITTIITCWYTLHSSSGTSSSAIQQTITAHKSNSRDATGTVDGNNVASGGIHNNADRTNSVSGNNNAVAIKTGNGNNETSYLHSNIIQVQNNNYYSKGDNIVTNNY